MTAKDDRRSRIRKYPIPVVQKAIDEIIYDETDRKMVRDMFVGNMTYREAETVYKYSRTGMTKHATKVADRLEGYLKKTYIN